MHVIKILENQRWFATTEKQDLIPHQAKLITLGGGEVVHFLKKSPRLVILKLGNWR